MDFLSLRQAAKAYMLPFSYVTLTRRVGAGQCPTHRRGNRIVVRRDEFEIWLEAITA